MPGSPLLEYERVEQDGLPIYRAPAARGAAAWLVFRAGQADETLPRRGLTHLVEHLVLAPQTRSSGIAGHVELLWTALGREGTPAEIIEWLQATGGALGDPPTDRLETERRVLSVEAAGSTDPGVAALLRLFYGARGPGLAAYDELGLRAVSAQDVVAHARRWFCRRNAAVVVAGDVELPDLRLPAGERQPAPEHSPRALATVPAEASRPNGPLALGAPMPNTAVTGVLASLLERRAWRALRHERGLAYDVVCGARPVARETRLLFLMTDVPAGDASAAAEALVGQVRAVAGGHIADSDVHEAIADVERVTARLEPHFVLLALAASELVRGRVRDLDEWLGELRSVTREQLADAAGSLAETMLVTLPEGASADLPVLESFDGAPVDGRRFRRRRAPRHPDATDVIVGEDGVSAVLDDQRAVTVGYGTCAAAVREIDGGLTLIDQGGHSVTIDPGDLRDGAEAVALAERNLDPAATIELDTRAQRLQQSARRPLRPWLVGEATELLTPRLGCDEELLLTAEASQGMRAGVLAVTDRRLIFVAKVLSEHVLEIPLTAINRLRVRRNPLWPKLAIEHAGTTTNISFLTISRLKEAAAAVGQALTVSRARPQEVTPQHLSRVSADTEPF